MLHIGKVSLSASTVPAAVVSVAAMLAVWLVPAEAQAQTFTTLYSFTGGKDGAIPYKGPVRDDAGNLYGVTFYGDDACPDSYLFMSVGCGTIWKLDTKHNLTTLVTFTGTNGADPDGNLTLRGDVLYGTTSAGGANDQGTLFSVTTAGKDFKLLHSFNGSDGAHPSSTPRFDSEGNLYSTTVSGGTGFDGNDGTGYGVLYELTKKGDFAVIHKFNGDVDGGQPGRIYLNSKGTIFGTTTYNLDCEPPGLPAAGCGTVYSFDTTNKNFQTLYTFDGIAGNAATPTGFYAPVLAGFDSEGNLYGAATYGGATYGYGELFEIKLSKGNYGSLTTLYTFTGGSDGAYPSTPAVLDTGEIIGTTEAGPVPVNMPDAGQGEGVLYEFVEKPEPKFSTLYTFSYNDESYGTFPFGTPVVTSSGLIYGTTAYGGGGDVYPCDDQPSGVLISYLGCGTIFEFNPKGK